MAKPKSQKREANVSNACPPLTQENFEKELKELAKKAKDETFFNHAVEWAGTTVRAVVILTLAAASSSVLQLTLSPVYGAIPASIWHDKLVNAACFLGWSGSFWLRRNVRWRLIDLLPLIAFYIPMVQYFLFNYSSTFGATYGPLITELLTVAPLLLLSASAVGLVVEEFGITGKWQSVPGIASFVFLKIASAWSANVIQSTSSKSVLLSRVSWQVQLAASYALLAPSKLLLYVVPALLHTAVFNTHVQTPWATQSLNSSLQAEGYRLIARQDSNTGYISVLESVTSQFRVLRCDHSLLGGVWTMRQSHNPVVAEPVYAIFTMLEAVRLIEAPVSVPDSEAQALVIGAGIGTSPGALMAHGINTTIVEIDPVVLEYAVKYFDLAPNHNAVIDDAVHYAAQVANDTTQRFDYIIHDVFTGGAEPIALFTDEFLRNLHRALKPDGVIAINYASDLLQPSTHLVIRTVLAIFPSCRIYRETATPTAAELAAAGQDFTNMVLFCRARSKELITFREPVERDFLRSGSRKAYLVPQHEILRDEFDLEDMGNVLRSNDTVALEETQRRSAVGHWNVMRTVVPGKIWELW
ncbi:hypothetical protein V492_04338 [Pseudogymnoascus sp. VKM F-4246]|nr:hypothetical protein V492_04338 [Pseudogymnoascus sp. VKM F-4246]